MEGIQAGIKCSLGKKLLGVEIQS